MKPTLATLLALAILAAGCATPSTQTSSSEAPHGNDHGAPTSVSPSAAPVPLLLTVAPLAATQNASITVSGTVNRAAQVSIGTQTVEVTAAWSLVVPLEFGQTNLTVTADDGQATVQQSVLAIRLASATMEVIYTAAIPPHPSTTHTVWWDPDAFASKPMYDAAGAEHPAIANIHDVMVTWTAQTGIPIVYGGPGEFGFEPHKFDGVGQPLSAAAPPYWLYDVNGETAPLGITSMEAHPGDVITWNYGG
ncbi:MAG: DUF4430 domain-containing protein [Candidatus Thermoplasmatota archaeon]